MQVVQTINSTARKIPNWAVYLLGTLPVIWVFYAGLTGQLGVDPVKAIERQLGSWSLQLLVAGLAITPLRTLFNINLIKLRRAVGVLAFFYVLMHLLVWLVLDIQLLWGEIWKDIVKRPYITVGFAAFVLLLPLVLTSNNFMVRRMGPVVWRNLHKLTYVIVPLGGIHYLWLVKGWQIEPMLYLAGIAMLLAMRVWWAQQKKMTRRVPA